MKRHRTIHTVIRSVKKSVVRRRSRSSCEENSHLQLDVCLTDRLSDCDGHLSPGSLLDYRGPQTPWAQADHRARLALPIHRDLLGGQMVPSFPLMSLFFYHQPFLHCLPDELAPHLCSKASSERQKKGGGGGEGARGSLQVPNHPAQADPGSLVPAQMLLHPNSEKLAPASSVP